MMQDKMSTKLPKIILFGDSLTQYGYEVSRKGWVASLSHAYIRNVDVVNRGYSGYTTEMAKHLLPSILEEFKADEILFMTIFLGANDASLKEENGVIHVPIENYKRNLKEMIEMIYKHKEKSSNLRSMFLVLITPPPVYERKLVEFCKERNRNLDRINENTIKYYQACLEVVEEVNADHGITGGSTNYPVFVLDTWKMLFLKQNTNDDDEKTHYSSDLHQVSNTNCTDINFLSMCTDFLKNYLHDGLHFDEMANEALFHELMKLIGTINKDLLPEKMAFKIAPWYDVDKEHLPNSLFYL